MRERAVRPGRTGLLVVLGQWAAATWGDHSAAASNKKAGASAPLPAATAAARPRSPHTEEAAAAAARGVRQRRRRKAQRVHAGTLPSTSRRRQYGVRSGEARAPPHPDA